MTSKDVDGILFDTQVINNDLFTTHIIWYVFWLIIETQNRTIAKIQNLRKKINIAIKTYATLLNDSMST